MAASPPLADRPPRIRWSIVVALFVVAGLFRFSYFYLDDLANGVSGTLVRRLLEEGTGNLASLVFFPIALVAERHFPLDESRWRRAWPMHVAGFALYSVAHTSFMALSRDILFPALGFGTYDYGRMPVRYFMVASQDFFSYVSFVGVLTLLRVQQKLREREVHGAQLERDAAKAQLAALGLRLQPHFLFNALNTISATVYEDPVAADELIGRLGDLLRQSIRTGEREEIGLAEELEVLRAYLALVEARFGDRMQVRLDVDPSTLGLAVPAFLLQPLVENAVKHGSSTAYAHTTIDVCVVRHADSLELRVENDADPSGDMDEPRLGTGLSTTRERLRLLYGADQSLEIARAGRRFRVTVRIPVHPASLPALPSTESQHARAHR